MGIWHSACTCGRWASRWHSLTSDLRSGKNLDMVPAHLGQCVRTAHFQGRFFCHLCQPSPVVSRTQTGSQIHGLRAVWTRMLWSPPKRVFSTHLSGWSHNHGLLLCTQELSNYTYWKNQKKTWRFWVIFLWKSALFGLVFIIDFCFGATCTKGGLRSVLSKVVKDSYQKTTAGM